MAASVLTSFSTEARSFHAVQISKVNINQVADELELKVLYENGLPCGLAIDFNLVADMDEYLVVTPKDILITDHETFDFFFNPTI